MYFLYILKCADGTLYTGITTDVIRRVREHNASNVGAKYTRSRRPVTIVYSRKYRSRSAAASAEFLVKQLSRREKFDIIARRKRMSK